MALWAAGWLNAAATVACQVPQTVGRSIEPSGFDATANGIDLSTIDTRGTDDSSSREFDVYMPTAKALQIFESRIRLNPRDHLSMIVAAQLHLREGREQSSHARLEKAEKLLRQALAIAPSNRGAQAWLVSAMVSQHKFREAVDLADTALQDTPDDLFLLSAKGDALLELGQVDEAGKLFDQIAKTVRTPGMLARLARLAELRGQPDQAIQLVGEALAESVRHEERAQTTAWYEYRLGILHLDQGQLDLAEKYFARGRGRNPTDSKLVNGLARVRIAKKELASAKRLYEHSIELDNSPATMALYADLLKQMGLTKESIEWLDNADRMMQRDLATSGTAHFRDRALFLLNHDRNPEQALELAQKDMESRQDIFAHDTLAWALHKNGQTGAALRHARIAISLGTRDASLYYHAARIARAGADPELADEWMQLAQSINPHAPFLATSQRP